MSNTLLIVISHSSEKDYLALDGLDTALTAVVLGVTVKILFLSNGRELLEASEAKIREKLEQLLSFENSSLYTTRSFNTVNGMSITAVNSEEIKQLFKDNNKILSF